MVRQIELFVKLLRNILFALIIIMLLVAYTTKKIHRHKVASQIPKGALKYIFFKKKPPTLKGTMSAMRRLLHRHNLEENILNTDIYGPIRKDTLVIVISVHTITIYLEFLLVSLSQVKGIDETLVVFSHLFFDENINELIQSIDFCRVLQIFYPYSTQMYPHEFPGYHWNDCPHDMNIKNAESLNCTSAFYPDIHGYYRNPVLVEKKHYWWWTANMVFETLTCTKNYAGNVVFLNDDLFMLQDSIYMIIKMKQLTEMLNLGEFLSLNAVPYSSENKDAYHVEIKIWNPTHDPDVIAFDASVWSSIASHYDLFCRVDDYSWARSLYYVSVNRRDGSPYRIVSNVVPRAFKTSMCGVNGYLVDCDAIESVYQVLEIQTAMSEDLFPAHLETYINVDLVDEFVSFDYAWSNGGFNDPRDKEFCQNLTRNKISKVLLDVENQFSNYIIYD